MDETKLRGPAASQPSLTSTTNERTGDNMRWPSQIAGVSFLTLVHAVCFVRGFASTSSPLPRPARRMTRLFSVTRMGPAPGLWKRKLPNTLGSWRVESVVDSGEPNSMFVFLFDDGSGEGGLIKVHIHES